MPGLSHGCDTVLWRCSWGLRAMVSGKDGVEEEMVGSLLHADQWCGERRTFEDAGKR